MADKCLWYFDSDNKPKADIDAYTTFQTMKENFM